MSGACPGFGSGCRGVATKSASIPEARARRTISEIQHEQQYRDEFYKYWETSMM